MASKKTGRGKSMAKTRKTVSTKSGGGGFNLSPKAFTNLKNANKAINKVLDAIKI